jgi:hypothetical protein
MSFHPQPPFEVWISKKNHLTAVSATQIAPPNLADAACSN